MADLRDFLARFRPAGAPGAAREETGQQAMAAARDEAATAARDAERQAARIREIAAQRMPALVGQAVDMIRRLAPDDS